MNIHDFEVLLHSTNFRGLREGRESAKREEGILNTGL